MRRYKIDSALAIQVNWLGIVRWLVWSTSICLMVALLSACTGELQPTPTATSKPTTAPTSKVPMATSEPPASITPEPTASVALPTVSPTTEVPLATSKPAETATPQPTVSAVVPTVPPAETALHPSELFTRISPSVVFLNTDLKMGSGVLIEGGYVLTNNHVVWPYDDVRVVLTDGTELEGVPVFNSDPLADLAVLGPIDVSAPSLTLSDGEDLTIGSDLYLVGYPAETDLFPQPTITSGILSRLREWRRVSRCENGAMPPFRCPRCGMQSSRMACNQSQRGNSPGLYFPR